MKSKKQLDSLVKSIKNEMVSGSVCDSLFRCAGWEKSMEKIIDAQRFLFVTKQIEYTGLPFRFCPWCGKQILFEKEE